MKTARSYQTESILAGVERNILIADECGLGKSYQAIQIADRFQSSLKRSQRYLPVLIICKKKAKLQWFDEIISEVQRPVIILDRPPEYPIKAPVWVITHYEAITMDVEKWMHCGIFAVIVLDEAHYIKNHGSYKKPVQRTKAIGQLKALRKIALTGTPIDRSAVEYWSVFHWLYPKDFRSYWRFFDQFANYQTVYIRHGEIRKQLLPGSKDPGGLAKLIRPFTFQRKKCEVLPDLPPKTFQTIRIDLEGQQAAIYQTIDASDDIECKLPNNKGTLFIPNKLAQMTLLQQVTSHPNIIRANGNLLSANSVKFDWLAEYLADNPTTPIVIFTRFQMTATYIRTLIGTIDREGRTEVGTIEAIGESLNMQWADVAIFFDLHWSSTKMEQAINRVHRMDITSPKLIIYLLAKDTIDELVLASVAQKWSEQELLQRFLSRSRFQSG
jgi:SNF2 family DNA or RNA helicase